MGAEKIVLSGINEEVEKRLQKQQEKKKIKDAGTRTGYSRKERAAYAAIITSSDLENIEKDAVIAESLIQKKRVWEKYNIEQLQVKGVSSGTAYIMDYLQKAFPSKPYKNTKYYREIYVKLAETFKEKLSDVYSLRDIIKEFESFTFLKVIELVETTETPYVLSERIAREVVSVRFYNAYIRSTSSYREIYKKAKQYDGVSKEDAKYEFDLLKKFADEYIKSLEKRKENAAKISSISEMRSFHRRRGFRGGYTRNYINTGDWAGYVKYVISVYEKFKKEQLEKLEKENLPFNAKESDPDWSWAFKTRKKSTTRTGITINSGKPLSFIKRVGGMQIDEISEKYILKHLGFKGVTFGNYVKDVDAKEHVRHFLGAMTDLCEILNFDPKFINKGLSIGFGAYGRGGRAMATFYPKINTINLTKKRGDGTVAHEWGHFLDFALYGNKSMAEKVYRYFDDIFKGNYKKHYFHEYVAEDIARLYKEFRESGSLAYIDNNTEYVMTKIMAYIRFGVVIKSEGEKLDVSFPKYKDDRYYHKEKEFRSEYYKASNAMSSKYWVDPAELFARAWEVYIFMLLEKQGRFNNYLVNGHFDNEVYPQGNEREDLFELFTELVQTIKKELEIPDFKAWNRKRADEYIEYEDKKDSISIKQGIVVGQETKKKTKSKDNSTKKESAEQKEVKEYLAVLKTNLPELDKKDQAEIKILIAQIEEYLGENVKDVELDNYAKKKAELMKGLDSKTKKILEKVCKNAWVNGRFTDITYYDYLQYRKNNNGKIDKEFDPIKKEWRYYLYTKYGRSLKKPKITKEIIDLFNKM